MHGYQAFSPYDFNKNSINSFENNRTDDDQFAKTDIVIQSGIPFSRP